jgi:phage terminase large subunit
VNLTNTFYKNLEAQTRYVINQGGTWSSKTYSIIQLLIMKAQKYDNKLISIVSESIPHLKRGALKDFLEIMIESGQFDHNAWNKTDSTYLFNNGTRIEFFSADNPGKVHGGRRDILYFNEIQNNRYEIFYQLAMRTKERIYVDYNPTHSFWVHEKYLDNPDYRDQITYIHSTFSDNPYIPGGVLGDIKTRAKNDENFRKVYVEGETGTLEGLIYSNWTIVDKMPEDFKWVNIGLDFGFTNHPTAAVRVGYADGLVYLDEMIYETNLVNTPNPAKEKNIVDLLKTFDIKRLQIIADSAEQKSISEIRQHGFNIMGIKKPNGSVIYGIDICKQQKFMVTQRSLNIIKEFRNYKWKIDKSENAMNEPVKQFDHAMDAIRYVIMWNLGRNNYLGGT